MGRFDPKEVTAEQVREYRDTTGAGMMEAKKHLRLRNLAKCMEDMRANATLEEKVEWILDRLDDQWWQ